MAVPTITDVSPSTGPAAGGSIITISGTNFRTYTPPSYGDINTEDPVYVEVTFNGVAASMVWVESATTILVEPPMYTGDPDVDAFPAVDVAVQNLDDDLVPIGGETDTASGAYTYKREPLRPPTLTLESPFTRITRLLLQHLRRQIMLSTSLRTHTDYSKDGVIIATAGTPSVHLLGPEVVYDAAGWENPDIDEEQGDGSYLLWPNPIMHTVGYQLIGQSDTDVEFHTLMGAATKFFRSNVYLTMDCDVPSGSTLRMPMILVEPPSTDNWLGNSNLHSFSCVFELRRVPVLYLPPILASEPVDSLELQTQKVNGTLVEIKSL